MNTNTAQNSSVNLSELKPIYNNVNSLFPSTIKKCHYDYAGQ